MIYRVVEMSDGMFKCQFRTLIFWWLDSCHEASRDLADQQRFARDNTDVRRPSPVSRAKIVRVVALDSPLGSEP